MSLIHDVDDSDGLFTRVAERQRARVTIYVDDRPVRARAGDTVLVALMLSGARLRHSEFGDGPRAGLCMMAACQDCWVTAQDGTRLRACSTYVEDGMRLICGGGGWSL